MNTTVEQALETHAARRYVYALGQTLFGGEPTAECLSMIDTDLLAEALEIVGLADDFDFTERVSEARDQVDKTCGLYTKLFIGPVTPKALPWESTYRSKSSALFRQETLEVRNAYRAQGLLPQAYPKVADDHIALELGFMAALAGRSAEALEAQNAEAATSAEEASQAFLSEHLLKWVDAYAEDLAREGEGSLYESLARLFAAFLHRDQELLAA